MTAVNFSRNSALNTTSRRLRLARLRVEQARAQSESLADSCKETPDAVPHADDAEASSTPTKSMVWNGLEADVRLRATRYGVTDFASWVLRSAFAAAPLTGDNLRVACQR